MAWTAPRTWVAAETLTAALLNTHVRDNLLEAAPAKVTTKGDLTVATAANSISRLAVGSNGAVLVADSGHTCISPGLLRLSSSERVPAFHKWHMRHLEDTFRVSFVSMCDIRSFNATKLVDMSKKWVYMPYPDAYKVNKNNWLSAPLMAALKQWQVGVWAAARVPPLEPVRTSSSLRAYLVQRDGRKMVVDPVLLQEFNISMVSFDRLSPDEQVRAVYDADILIGHHGAGLTNVLFMRSGSVLVQLMPWNLCNWNSGVNEYLLVASMARVLHAQHCVPRSGTANWQELRDKLKNAESIAEDRDRQGELYMLDSLTLVRNDLESIMTNANAMWTTSQRLSALSHI